MRPTRIVEPREMLAYGRQRVDITRSQAKGDAHVAATRILWEHRIQRDRVGNCRGTLHLAGTPPSTTLGGLATAAHPAQLPLPRNGIPGPGRRLAGSATCLRHGCGLWRHRRRSSGAAVAVVLAKCSRLTHGVDLQRLGLRRSRERLLPGERHRPLAWTVGSDLLHSSFDRAAAAHHARPRVPASSAASTGTRDGAEPTARARIEA